MIVKTAQLYKYAATSCQITIILQLLYKYTATSCHITIILSYRLYLQSCPEYFAQTKFRVFMALPPHTKISCVKCSGHISVYSIVSNFDLCFQQNLDDLGCILSTTLKANFCNSDLQKNLIKF